MHFNHWLIGQYAAHTEFKYAAEDTTQPPDFRVYTYKGVAYLLAISRRANRYMIAHHDGYSDYRPVKMSVDDINLAAQWAKYRTYIVEMDAI